MKKRTKFILLLLAVFFVGTVSAQSTLSYSANLTENCDFSYNFECRSLRNPSLVFDHATWNFGDGTPVVTYSDYSAPHVFASSGTYTVSVTMTYTNSSTSTYSVTAYFMSAQDAAAAFSYTESGGIYSFIFEGADFDPNLYHNGTIDFGDNTFEVIPTNLTNGALIATHSYAATGTYTVTLNHTITVDGQRCAFSTSLTIEVTELPPLPCCSNFAPLVGERYWLSAWVLEESGIPVKNYNNTQIRVEFVNSGAPDAVIIPSGELIDDWQRLVGDFIIPAGTTEIKIHLINTNASVDAYFDDIRVHPFNASMKSYVYDPETLWLTAELDDNNYATFYEYDNQGQLIRIKKETARGVMTIQESRSSNKKL